MAKKVSAGILLWRTRPDGVREVLLAHPGGPLFAEKDAGVWTIPKGELDAGEAPLAAARREFGEETGFAPPAADRLAAIGTVTQRSGKVVHGFAAEGDADPSALRPGTFTMEWPPRSGRTGTFPEVDRVAWFDLDAARARINPAQAAFLDRLPTG